MSRKSRGVLPKGSYEVSNRPIPELKFVKDFKDKFKFIKNAMDYGEMYHVKVLDIKVNERGFKMIVHDSKGKLSEFMKCVEGTYCQHHYNKKNKRNGTIFCGRFQSVEIKGGEHIHEEYILGKKSAPLNDGNIDDFDLDMEIILEMIKDNFKVDISKFLLEKIECNEEEKDVLSILVFSLRSFGGCIHRKICDVLIGLDEWTSSILSLRGLKLILSDKYKWFYFRLWMVIFSDKRNAVST